MINYTVDRLFTTKELDNLKSLYLMCEKRLAHQDYNLFDVEKRMIHPKLYTDEIKKVDKYAEMTPMSHYFVKYSEGSFTRLHTDDRRTVGKTIVTLVESNGLIGGETLMYEVYPHKPRPKNKYAKRSNKEVSYGKSIIPVVVPMEDGQSVVYGHDVTHGVCQVHSGDRLVLVSWYKK